MIEYIPHDDRSYSRLEMRYRQGYAQWQRTHHLTTGEVEVTRGEVRETPCLTLDYKMCRKQAGIEED